MRNYYVRLRDTHADETGCYSAGEEIRVPANVARQLVERSHADAVSPIPPEGSPEDLLDDPEPNDAAHDSDGWGEADAIAHDPEEPTTHAPATRRRRRPS